MSRCDWDSRVDQIYDAWCDDRDERAELDLSGRQYWVGRGLVDHLIDGEQR